MADKHTHTIDAAGKTLGRVAAEAAKALMGKTRADYTPHVRSNVEVTVNNADKMYIREKKRRTKIYNDYSGHPGGLKQQSLAQLTARKGTGEAIRRAVKRMLPRNTMLTARMKNLKVNA